MKMIKFQQSLHQRKIAIHNNPLLLDPHDIYILPETLIDQMTKQHVPLDVLHEKIPNEMLYKGQSLTGKKLLIFFVGGIGDCLVFCSILDQMLQNIPDFQIYLSATTGYHEIVALFKNRIHTIPPIIRFRELVYYDYVLQVDYIGKYMPFKQANLLKCYTDLLNFVPDFQDYSIKVPERKLDAMRLNCTSAKSVGIFPGGNDPLRTLSADYTNDLALSLISAGFMVYLLGTAIKDFQPDLTHPKFVNMLGRTVDLLEAAAIITQLDFMISVDGSLMHLAALLNKQTIALFNVIDPKLRVGHYKNINIIQFNSKCSPCFSETRTCPLNHSECLWLKNAEFQPEKIVANLHKNSILL